MSETSETWVKRLVHLGLRMQHRVTTKAPIDLKKATAGRKAKMVIEGEDGGVFYLRWSGAELIEEFDESDVRNGIYMHSQTLLDLVVGELGAREALAASLIIITGDRSFYDSVDLIKLVERFQSMIVRAWNAEYGSGVKI